MIAFNKPHMTGKELSYIAESHINSRLAGDGPYTDKCHIWLENNTKTKKALLTHSCTAALEMAAILLDIQPGDEVIMPSFTFVSTANAFVIRGAKPVFVDVREDTLNIDEKLIEKAITAKTKAIVPVHYAGVACEMDTIMSIAESHGIAVVEDAAQGIMSKYKSRALGSIGDIGAYSFHETKNLICGEGGALLVNNEEHSRRAEIIREKGTDRSQFFRGEVDKYTWQEPGSSFLPGELNAAFLWAQFEDANSINAARLKMWDFYHTSLKTLEDTSLLKRPTIPQDCEHNAHIYYIVLPKHIDRKRVISKLKERNIATVFHYVPLHSSPAGKKYGRVVGSMQETDLNASQLIRLPLWIGLTTPEQELVVECLEDILLNRL